MGSTTSKETEIVVDTTCISDPCAHRVHINGQDYGIIHGCKIIELHKKYNKEIPVHFQNYEDRVRSRLE